MGEGKKGVPNQGHGVFLEVPAENECAVLAAMIEPATPPISTTNPDFKEEILKQEQRGQALPRHQGPSPPFSPPRPGACGRRAGIHL
ncbi:hypothetical protein Y1Q_0003870 [Alligator mississippiensis]|uniref:Uncharacterized protein n=1 Tax=Alligator mississippiensis TaxID=8496 RepID=A0A151MNL5_ALLMI|nr:hypothetical protein Y1Q_0003870 [Alligator mississippiensis]